MNDWHIEVPSDQRTLGQTGDNLSYRLEIRCDPIDASFSYKLDVENKYHEKDILDLNRSGNILWTTIQKEYLTINGSIRLQVRGINGPIVRHSNTFLMEIGYSIDSTGYFATTDISEFAQLEVRLTEIKEEALKAVEDAKAAAALAVNTPYIGQNGNWFVYSHADGGFVDSGFPSSRVGEQGEQGIQGIPGRDGRSFTLKAMYETYETLLTKHPTGQPGDAYCVGTEADNTAYFWDEEQHSWKSIGSLRGETGKTGSQGEQGIPGEPGKAASIAIGTVVSIPFGSDAEVVNTGTATDAILSFKLPVGDTGLTGPKGDAATIKVGNVTTVDSSAEAEVINSGTGNDVVLDFKLPKGATGENGKSFTIRSRYDSLEALLEAHPTGTAGDAYLVGFGDDSYVYIWNEDISFWDNIGHMQGPQGEPGVSPTVTVGNVVTGAPGTNAKVENTGTDQKVNLVFTIPAGETGKTGETGPAGQNATLTVGEVQTGEAGTPAAVTNTGTETDAVLNFTLPRGETGLKGADGVSITGAALNADYHLILTLSNGETIDAGYAKGADGEIPSSIDASIIAGTLPVSHGGTDATDASSALWNLMNGSETAESNEITENSIVPIGSALFGTGRKTTLGKLKDVISPTKLSELRNDCGFLTDSDSIDTSAISGVLPLTKGGTGQTGAAAALYALLNGSSALSSSAISASDYLAVGDVSAGTAKKITLTNLATALGGGVVFGTYTGNQDFPSSGTYTSMQSISLGFQPKFVLVGQMSFGWQPPLARYVEDYTDVTDVRLAYATPSNPYSSYYGTKKSFIDTITVLEVTSSGFSVRNAFHITSSGSSSNWGYNGQYALNESGRTYFYLAIK